MTFIFSMETEELFICLHKKQEMKQLAISYLHLSCKDFEVLCLCEMTRMHKTTVGRTIQNLFFIAESDNSYTCQDEITTSTQIRPKTHAT